MNFFINYLLRKFQSSKNTSEFRVGFSIFTMVIFAFLMHLIFLCYFLYIQIYPMVFFNCCSLLVYSISLFYNRIGKNHVASILVIIEVTLYSAVSTFLMGPLINAHWLILIAFIPQFLFLDFTKTQKIILSVFMWVTLNACLHFDLYYPPLYPQHTNYLLKTLILNMVLVSVMLELAMNSIITRILDIIHAIDVEKFKQLSYIDPLTQLQNRRYADVFFERISHSEMPRHDQFFFAMLDIDDFKQINDDYGHKAGDAILESIADVMRKNIRQTDLICRWGGEEFLIVMCGCTPEKGFAIIDTVRKNIEDLVYHSELGDVFCTITGGGSPLIDNNIKLTIEACDRKLYEGKRSGKNKIVV